MNIAPELARPTRLVLDAVVPCLIDGEERLGADHLDAIEPSTGERWARVALADELVVNQAVSAAARSFSTWRRTTLARRQQLLWEVADRLEADAERWPRLLATENGRAIREAGLIDVPTAAAIFRYFAGVAVDIHGVTVQTEPADRAHIYTTRQPIGVVAALVPWNSPLISIAHKLAPALAAGNTVVLKPSELASVSAVEFARLVQDIFPPGVVNVVTGRGGLTGRALVSHRDVAKISFTGGTSTGRDILSSAGAQLTPSLMELGGKGSMIVCPDADLATLTEDILTGAFAANGEVCFASSRLLVHENLYDDVLERMVERAEAIVVGDALDPNTQVGPLINSAHRDRIARMVESAVHAGAEVCAGGRTPSLADGLDRGAFYRPTVIASPDGSTAASCDEFFGPVLTVERWSDECDAVERANAVDFGLANGVWTSDLARAHRIANELESGMVWVNTWFATPLGQPQGGIKASGFGREGAAETLAEYQTTKVVNISLENDRPPLWA